MKKILIIVISVLVVVAIAVGVWLFIMRGSNNTGTQESNTENVNTEKTIKLTNFEVTLESVDFGSKLCNLEYDEDYLLPTEESHREVQDTGSMYVYSYLQSPLIVTDEDNIYCVITYTVKNISEEMMNLSSDLRVGSHFRIVYNDKYYMDDISQSTITPSTLRYPAIKTTKSKFIRDSDRDYVWVVKNGTYNADEVSQEYCLYPLESKTIREYIKVPKDLVEKYKDNLKIQKAFIRNMKYRGGDNDKDAYDYAVWDIEYK